MEHCDSTITVFIVFSGFIVLSQCPQSVLVIDAVGPMNTGMDYRDTKSYYGDTKSYYGDTAH